MTRNLRFVACLVLAGLGCGAFAQEQAPAASPREQLNQYVTQLQANPSDDALRTKIIQLALTLDPKPAAPADAAIAAAKGKTIFGSASSPDDMKAAAAAFAQAAQLAPWVPEYYYNEALALEKAKQYDDAIHALNFYLLAAPNASDVADVRGKIEGIRYEKDSTAKQEQQTAERQVEDAAERQRQFLDSLIGTWISRNAGNSDSNTYSFSTTGGNAFRIDWTAYNPGNTGARSGTNSIELRGSIVGHQVSGSYSYSYTVPRGWPCPGQHDQNGTFIGSVSEDGATIVVDEVKSGVQPDFTSGGCRNVDDQHVHEVFTKE